MQISELYFLLRAITTGFVISRDEFNKLHERKFSLKNDFPCFQQWCDELVKLAYNLTQLNGSATMFLQKAHVKLSLQVDKSGKIPVKK